MRDTLILFAAVACTAVLFSAPVAVAQEASTDGGPPPPVAVAGDDPALAPQGEAPAWGTSDFTMVHLGPPAFVPRNSSVTWQQMGAGYLWHSGGSGSYLHDVWTPVVLPAGALLGGFRVFYYDNSTSDISVWLTRYHGDTNPDYQDIVNWSSSGTPGYTSTYITVSKTITYRDTSGDEQNFNIIVRLPDASADMAIRSIRLLYYLQVSPAPATATFNDVPTTHWAFKFVEALAASGITGGCGGGNYCPDDPLTRAQMAVFLSDALGLYWSGNEGSSF